VRRTAAAERFASKALPSTDEEVWRYSRVADLDLDAYRPAEPTPGPAPRPAAGGVLDSRPLADLTWRDGTFRHRAAAPDGAGSGVYIGSLAEADGGDGALGSVLGRSGDVFTDMNTAFLSDGVLIRVPAGVQLDGPILVRHLLDVDGGAVFPRLVVQAGEGSRVAIVDHVASADVNGFVSPVVEIDVGRAANVTYVNVQELGPRVWQIASHVAQVGQEANFVSASIALGGEYARLRTDCRMVGRGASGQLMSAYFGEGDQTLDFRTFQDHRAPDTTSDLLFKGAVGGRSRSVYTGLIRVRKEARGTNAFQTNRNIKLSDDAWAESVPNLEIETNDVHCSHASTVGPIDEEQRFYLESRGVPPEVAERLVVSGFFDDVLRRIPVEGLAGPMRRRIEAKLDRELPS